MHQPQKAGCYGVVAGSKDYKEELELPLKKLNFDVELSQCLAYLQTEQFYFNSSNKLLDVQYIFPVYPNAAIVNFQISFGGHTSKGIVKSKEQAEKQYKQNLDQGRQVGYGGYYYNQQSRDVMKIKLGNVNPNEEIKVKISYVHTVSVSYNTFYQFRLSTTITPRYASRQGLAQLNQIEFTNDKSRQVQGKCVWTLNIKIKSRRQLLKFFSTSHKIGSAKVIGQNSHQIFIDQTNMMPNKDFNLYYTFQDFNKPVCMLGQIDHKTEAIISFVPKFCNLEIGDAQKRAIQNKQYPISMTKTKGQYIFFLDRSGSMGGQRIAKAKQALLIFLKSLPLNSYFNVVSFGNRSELLFSQSRKYETQNFKEALQKIKQMDADMGGTQILQAIQKCMEVPIIPDYTRQIFLLTDGSVSNTSNVVSYASLHTQSTRYNCIGIGNGCSQDLIINCAQKGKGYSMFISDQQDPSDKIVQILQKSLSPVISKMSINIPEGVESIVPNPEKLPYILKNQLANFYITFNEKIKNPVTINIKYTDSLGQNYNEKVQISPKNALNCNYVNKMVSYTSINTLYNVYKYREKTEDHIYFVKQIKKEQLAQKITKISIQKQILTELTAFICVDSSKADQIIKSYLKNQKESISIQPMNPADHILPVSFGQGLNDLDSSSDIYMDECCVIETEYPQANPENASKTDFSYNKKQTDQYFQVIDKSSAAGLISIKTHPKFKDAPTLLQFIEKQQLSGAWIIDEILIRALGQQDYKFIKKLFQGYSKDIWATLAIIKNIELFNPDIPQKARLILRKAKEYLSNSSKQQSDKIQAIWYQKVRNPNAKIF